MFPFMFPFVIASSGQPLFASHFAVQIATAPCLCPKDYAKSQNKNRQAEARERGREKETERKGERERKRERERDIEGNRERKTAIDYVVCTSSLHVPCHHQRPRTRGVH